VSGLADKLFNRMAAYGSSHPIRGVSKINIHIRKATISDIDILIKLRFDLLSALYGNLTKDEEILIREQLATYFINHINYDLIAILAEIDNNIASTAVTIR
jgi:hypothetical protein